MASGGFGRGLKASSPFEWIIFSYWRCSYLGHYHKITCFSSPAAPVGNSSTIASSTSLFPRRRRSMVVLCFLLPSSAARGSLWFKKVYMNATVARESISGVGDFWVLLGNANHWRKFSARYFFRGLDCLSLPMSQTNHNYEYYNNCPPACSY